MPRHDAHREPMVRAAQHLLRQRGVLGMSSSAVLAASGAANGSLYHHFPGGKEELARVALGESSAQVAAALRRLVSNGVDPSSAIADWVTGLVEALQDDPLNGCPIAPTALEAPLVSKSLTAVAAQAFASWADILATAMPGDPEERAARARVLLCCVEGALLLDRTEGGTRNLEIVRRSVPGMLAMQLD